MSRAQCWGLVLSTQNNCCSLDSPRPKPARQGPDRGNISWAAGYGRRGACLLGPDELRATSRRWGARGQLAGWPNRIRWGRAISTPSPANWARCPRPQLSSPLPNFAVLPGARRGDGAARTESGPKVAQTWRATLWRQVGQNMLRLPCPMRKKPVGKITTVWSAPACLCGCCGTMFIATVHDGTREGQAHTQDQACVRARALDIADAATPTFAGIRPRGWSTAATVAKRNAIATRMIR